MCMRMHVWGGVVMVGAGGGLNLVQPPRQFVTSEGSAPRTHPGGWGGGGWVMPGRRWMRVERGRFGEGVGGWFIKSEDVDTSLSC